MDKKDAQQIKSNYCIAATVAGLIAMALYFTSQFLVTGKILVALAILFAICFIVLMIKAFIYSRAAKTDKSAESAKTDIAKTSTGISKVGMIISGIVLALSILAPVITMAIIGIQCDARGAIDESTCPEMWAVMIIMFFSVPCAGASGLCLLIAAINYFTNKKKLKKSA